MAILLALVGDWVMGTMSINVLDVRARLASARHCAPNRGVAAVFILEGVVNRLAELADGAVLAIPMSQGLNQALGQAVMARH